MLKWGSLRLDTKTCKATFGDQPLDLTPNEYGLLELFLRNQHRIFSSGEILYYLWSFAETPGEDTVRASMKSLRIKLINAGVTEDPIETVYGIGYRLKPDETAKSEKLKLQQQTVEIVTSVWQRVKEKFSNRIAVVEQATIALQQHNLSEELKASALREAHKLAGSLGMFGFHQGSRLAQQLEQLFEVETQLDPNQAERLSEILVELRQELKKSPTQHLAAPVSSDERPLLLIVNSNTVLAQNLALEATNWGMRTQTAIDSLIAHNIIANARPDIVLLDLAASDSTEDNLVLLEELCAYTPPIPVLVLTAQDSLIDRVKVARLGGRGFLQQSIPPYQVLEAVNQVLKRYHTAERVMVVDDDPLILSVIRSLLEPWGLKVYTLDNPLVFWETLAAVSPDLLVLDVKMPEITGIELCQILRNHPNWNALPVLFLTAYASSETISQVFAVGADDFISKPIVEPELIVRIINRLERSRLLRQLAETDTLTKVTNRRKSIQQLTQLLELSDHHNQPLCFAILQLNELKQLNDDYSYALGDEVLAKFGDLLRQTFHSDDVIVRWGGAEFIVGMYGMTRTEGIQRLEILQDFLSQHKFRKFNHYPRPVTFNVGIVQYPQDGSDLETLYRSAEMALRQIRN